MGILQLLGASGIALAMAHRVYELAQQINAQAEHVSDSERGEEKSN